MTKENAHLFLPLVQAWIDGKTLQNCGADYKWYDIQSASFASDPHCYRIKPEPRVIWINDTYGLLGTAHDSLASANENGGIASVAIKFVEVMG